MKNLLIALCTITSISAVAESPAAILIQKIQCGNGTPNTSAIQKSIGSIGSLTTESVMKMLVKDSDGSIKKGAGLAENSSMLAIVVPVSGDADSFCISATPTFINITLKK